VLAIEPSHLGICVSDLERSMRFYCSGLGFEAGDPFELDSAEIEGLDRALEVPGRTRIVSQFVSLGDMRIELLHWHEPTTQGRPSRQRNQLGITHLAFWVDDVEATARRLVEHGGTLVPDTRSNPGVQLVFVTDPDGVRVELMGRPAG
jgi:catechol 2,3-dioxygenase-like lactoylglutathione lyase family enzyme